MKKGTKFFVPFFMAILHKIRNLGDNNNYKLNLYPMKALGILVLTALFFSCASQQNMTNKTGRLGIKDSTRYELIVFDPGFDYWMATHKSIVNQHNNEYYQFTNYRYAQEWNRRYASGDPRVNSYIDYSMRIDYGFDFNYKLYMYFKFFEDTNKVKLIPGSGRL